MRSPDDMLTVRVSEVRAQACDVMQLELRGEPARDLPAFEPGAHIDLHLPNGLARQYSLLNDWRERDRYVIAVGRAAPGRGGSRYLHDMVRRDTRLAISAPRNNFPLQADAASYVFVAGGIGITPILAMIRWCQANRKPWRLVYASRSRQRAAFYEELREAFAQRVRFHFDDESGGPLDVAAALRDLASTDSVYCCGPAPLMQAVRQACGHLPEQNVRFEWFSSAEAPVAQHGADGGFWIDLAHSNTALFVAPEQSILQVLEDYGLDVPNSCREGLCGTCEATVLQGEPDHRDFVRSPAEHARCRSIMLCVSRAKSARLALAL